MHGAGEGETGVDDDLAAQGFENIGAWILGRNMFGPVRGPWPDDNWRGWWGEEPPYHVPVFVLTHHARAPLAMKGGTEFRFVTEGIEAALAQAKEAAGEKDVRSGAAWPRFASISAPASSTSSTSPSRPSCSVKASTCSAVSTCGHLVTRARSTWPVAVPLPT
jgi:hypothetical protein